MTKENPLSTNLIELDRRENLCKALTKLIQRTKGPLTIALDAPWGSSKTCFVKQWIEALSSEGHQCIYFDAFAHEYQGDPLLDLAASIYDSLSETNDEVAKEYLEIASNAFKVISKVGLKIGTRFAFGTVLSDTELDDLGLVQTTANESMNAAENILSQALKNHSRKENALESFKSFLSGVSENSETKSPLVIVVDELDRCRPNYALDVLETMKHIFAVKGVVFCIATHRVQLEATITKTYGEQSDPGRYLQKFISNWIRFPENAQSRVLVMKSYAQHQLEVQSDFDEALIRKYVHLIANYGCPLRLSLREIEHVIFSIVLGTISAPNLNWTTAQEALCILAIMKVRMPSVYKDMAQGVTDYSFVQQALNIENDNSWSDPESSFEAWVVRYIFDSTEGRSYLLRNSLKYSRDRDKRDDNVLEEVQFAIDLFN